MNEQQERAMNEKNTFKSKIATFDRFDSLMWTLQDTSLSIKYQQENENWTNSFRRKNFFFDKARKKRCMLLFSRFFICEKCFLIYTYLSVRL